MREPSQWRQPAEWSEHEATWLAWPSHGELWLENLAPARAASAALCRAIATGERVELLCRTDDDERSARAVLGDLDLRVHRIGYGDIWLRDTAPIFVAADGDVRAVDFGFDGWGGKYLFDDDPPLGARVAAAADITCVPSDLVLEGGALDTDGEGTFLTTRQCLLDGVRNPGASEADYEAELARTLGAAHVIWLDEGLANDHTDGHVDTLARFVAPGVVACMEPAPGDPNRGVLDAIITALGAARDAAGRRLEVVRLPSPGTVLSPDGALMPASYANFYIANRAVAVPTYGVAADDAAVAAVAALFPDRQTVAIDARATLSGGGAFHCITQQQPPRI